MRLKNSFFLLIFIGSIFFYFIFTPYGESVLGQKSDLSKERSTLVSDKYLPVFFSQTKFEEDLSLWMNKSSEDLKKVYGEPIRKELSMYGYVWWVYKGKDEHYIQFGIHNNKVETIFALGEELEVNHIRVGDTYEQVSKRLEFKKEVTYHSGPSFYTFVMNENDIKEFPLLHLKDDIFIQYYFDNVTKKLSSVRLITGDKLLLHVPYKIKYSGKLPDEPDLTKEEWDEVEKGMEKQIFELTNILRSQMDKSPLVWHEDAGKAAFSHSKNMSENNFFSHYGLDGTGLKERLISNDIAYTSAGENIAAQYTDGPAAVQGWVNSEEHREALFSDEFTHLGVGVFRMYYTQNFLANPF